MYAVSRALALGLSRTITGAQCGQGFHSSETFFKPIPRARNSSSVAFGVTEASADSGQARWSADRRPGVEMIVGKSASL